MFLLDRLFLTMFLSKSLWASKSFKKSNQWMYLGKIFPFAPSIMKFLTIWIPQSDFDKKCVTKKLVK